MLVALALPGALRMGGEFLPKLGEGAMVINVVRLAGIAIEEATDSNTRIERLVLRR